MDLLDSFGLQQHVDKPTHTHSHTLNLVITRKVSIVIHTLPRVDRYFSDHASIVCDLRIKKSVAKVRTVTFRKLRSVNMADLQGDLASYDLCTADNSERREPADLDKFVENYKTTLSGLINHYAPIKIKRVRSRPQVPCYNEKIAEAKRQRRRVERIWQRSKLTSDFLVFKEKKNNATFIINKARKAFYTDFINVNSCDQGKLFREMRKLLAPKDYIGRFFCSKINNIDNWLDAVASMDRDKAPDDLTMEEDQRICEFQQLSYDDVRSLVQKSAKKTCILDPMLTSMFVVCLEELLPLITCILNSSLSLGHFPSKWKEALVDPRLKKSVKDILFSNLRPVSNLQFLSKLVERAVSSQVHELMMKFQLYPLLQSAYRSGHSTETALLKVHNDILLNMDRQRVTLLVLLDPRLIRSTIKCYLNE